MSGNMYAKNIRRTIWGSMGRYIAILAIIALGVGFFAGVKNTKGSMMLTCDEYVNEFALYDFRLVSTYGFNDDDVAAVAAEKSVADAEGAITADFFSEDRDGNSMIIRAHSITENINKVDLTAGRMPKADDECVVDAHFYTKDNIGSTIVVTDENDDTTKDALSYREYKIVGIAQSPYYMMKTERGTTSIGDGTVDAFIYAPQGAFTSEYFTELLVTSKEQGFVFSDEYYDNTARTERDVTDAAEKSAESRYDDIVSEAQEEIESGQQELDDGRVTLEQERQSTYARLADAKATLDESSAQISSGRQQLESQKASLTSQRVQVAAAIAQIEAQLAALEQQGQSGDTGDSGSDSGGAGEDQGSELEAQLRAQLAQLQASLAQIDSGLEEISAQENTLAVSQRQVQQGYSQYRVGMAQADSSFAEAETQLEEGEAELEQARSELSDLAEPEIYVYDREDNLGFGSFESNADIVDSIAQVFPVFFFLIAALVCSTTMSRMIDEERPQVGAFSALGYTSGKIMFKYMIYSGSAAFIGCVAGFLAGSKYFPYAIWIAYGMMFGFADLEYYFDWQLAAISLVVSLLCSTGTTYLACRGMMKHMPAEILRPKAPKAGKRIFLERIGFLWKRLKFLHKVSARNIFRYKKRMIMMIVGIGGCTSLVLAGFGINDSVAGIAEHQYSQIEKYQMAVAFDGFDDSRKTSFETEYQEELSNVAQLQQSSVNVKGSDDVTKSCSLMVSDDNNITKAVNFADDDGNRLEYPGRGEAMINNKLADMIGVKTGDEIQVTYDDTKTATLTVSGIYRNYVSNYIYINEETYEEEMGKTYEPYVMFVSFDDGVDVHDMAERINGFDGVISITVNEDMKAYVDDMMVSLNYIIILVIGCAGALAFIVLFNLGNINITEREREIATIEVLGFYPREMGSYVFRENFILVLLGIIAGLPAGFALHRFIMSRIVVDAVSFNNVVEPVSYLFTVLVVLGFAVIVDVILRRKLRRINMAEALKSVE